MKEATGELNAAVIVIVAIGVMIAFFYYTLWPMLQQNFEATANCSKAICETSSDSNGYATCYTKGHYGEDEYKFQCVYKG